MLEYPYIYAESLLNDIILCLPTAVDDLMSVAVCPGLAQRMFPLTMSTHPAGHLQLVHVSQ